MLPVRYFSSRDFNQNTSEAKHLAEQGPVYITRRGQPTHVLLSFKEWEKLHAAKPSLADALGLPEAADIEFQPKPSPDAPQPAEFD
jgi:prevent-host-death family protein